jgi:hypothetical protein
MDCELSSLIENIIDESSPIIFYLKISIKIIQVTQRANIIENINMLDYRSTSVMVQPEDFL